MKLRTIQSTPLSYCFRWPIGSEEIPLQLSAQKSWGNDSLGRDEH